jgi:hypothetical protein
MPPRAEGRAPPLAMASMARTSSQRRRPTSHLIGCSIPITGGWVGGAPSHHSRSARWHASVQSWPRKRARAARGLSRSPCACKWLASNLGSRWGHSERHELVVRCRRRLGAKASPGALLSPGRGVSSVERTAAFASGRTAAESRLSTGVPDSTSNSLSSRPYTHTLSWPASAITNVLDDRRPPVGTGTTHLRVAGMREHRGIACLPSRRVRPPPRR